ncbi:MAG: hypothetical protein EOO90_03780 [Pedobacter sp.]|nr:MAG: hypothetical protein EOO90_03780 [Pedobacter sp.]
MKFEELYNEAVKMWPEVIDISDGVVAENGILFKRLSSIWNEVELIAKSKGEWYDLMSWIIFANLHDMARHQLQHGLSTVDMANMSKDNVRTDLIENLGGDDFKDMLEEFIQLNPDIL